MTKFEWFKSIYKRDTKVMYTKLEFTIYVKYVKQGKQNKLIVFINMIANQRQKILIEFYNNKTHNYVNKNKSGAFFTKQRITNSVSCTKLKFGLDLDKALVRWI